MTAKELIQQVEAQNAQNWANSDILAEHEEMLRQIADHLTTCEDCRKAFNGQQYESDTLIDFTHNYLPGTRLKDWVCELAGVHVNNPWTHESICVIPDWEDVEAWNTLLNSEILYHLEGAETPQEWAERFVELVGPDEAGRIMIGS